MAGKEYRARAKRVQKMSRDGLLEENLTDGSVESINRKGESPPKIRSPEQRFYRRGEEKTEEVPDKKKRRLYDSARHSENPVSDECEHEEFPESEDAIYMERENEPPERAALLYSEGQKKKTSVQKKYARESRSSSERPKQEIRKPAEKRKPEEPPVMESSRRLEKFKDSSGASGIHEEQTEEVKHKRKKRLVQEYSEKKVSRLHFDDEDTGLVKGAGTGIGKKSAELAVATVKTQLREKIRETDSDNAALEGASYSEAAAERTTRVLKNVQERRKKQSPYSKKLKEKEVPEEARRGLRFDTAKSKSAAETVTRKAAQSEAKKKEQIKRFLRKRRISEAYAIAKDEKKAEQTVRFARGMTAKARQVAKEIFRRNSGFLIGVGIFGLLFAVLATSLGSCSAGIQGFGTTFVGTTYASTDTDIYAVENAYTAWEEALNEQMNSMEDRHEGYDEYRYNIDEIGHNPYHLISYFTVKYGEFTYEQVAGELREIFEEQYSIATHSHRETVTETRTVRVGESLGNVVTSGYCNCSICCGRWAGGPTASGAYPTPNHTIAVDASNPFVPMGTKVIMNGVEYTVEDTGAFDQYGVQFDVYYGDHASASAHGHQTWEAFIADDNGNREVEVTQTQDVNRMDVTLTNHSLDAVLRNRMNSEEEKRYDLYNHTYGNRSYLFDTNSLPLGGGNGGGGFGYEIPAEALSDEKFAKMIHEAEKYLGYPYVWGGASPSTSFDCSGFVSWVINNCGNGWNVGRQTADGLRGCCAQVSPSQAKPGDLIFFQGTYDTPGASHVGIYVGDGVMIHCGDPIKYTNIQTSYWQQHFMAFGRLP